jgi:hypothetical protein
VALAVDGVHVSGEWIRHAPHRSDLPHEGWPGLLTRSAARPHALFVCIFANDWPPAGCTPLRTVAIATVPPPPRGMTT